MADVRPGTKPRQPSKKSHTSAADEPKLLDSLTVADGSCNASTVPLVNYSFKVNVTKLFFDGERADARGADLIWALYNLLSFTVRVLVPLVYGLMKECGSGFLYTLLVRTHLDIIMPMPFVLSTFVGGAIVGLQKVRNLFLQTGPDRRRGCSMGDMARSMVMAIFMETVWWLALPCIFLCWPLFKLLRLLIVIDRILYAFGMLMYGLCMVCYGGVRYILIGCFNQTLSWVCWVYGVPANELDVSDYVFMMTDSSENDWDARKYPKARPYYGKRGIEFEKFVRDFGAALTGMGDDDASLEETMFGMDPGGNALGAPAAIAGVAAGRRRTKRLRELYSLLYRHVPEPRLREMMHANAANDGRAAFEMLEANCRQVVDDLELLQMDADWNSATILNTVGYSIDSITLFARHLNGLNALRPFANRKTEDESTTKFLSSIDTNIESTLGHESMKELRAQGAARQFVNAAGGRDYQACITFFDDLWRSHFRAGDIRARPRQSGPSDRSARADANVINDGDETALFAGAARQQPVDRQQMGTERVCWNCRGFGHSKDECPSTKGFRAISDAVFLLSNMLPRGGKGSFGRGGGGSRGGAGRGSWRRPVRRFGNAKVVLDQGLVFDDDGNIFDADGAFVGTVESQQAEPATTDDKNEAGSSEPPPVTEEAEVVSDFAGRFNDADADGEWIGDMYVTTDVPNSDVPPDYWGDALRNVYVPPVYVPRANTLGDTGSNSDAASSSEQSSNSGSTNRDLAGEIECTVAGVSEKEIQMQAELFAAYDNVNSGTTCDHEYTYRGYCDDLDCDGYVFCCDKCHDWYCDGCCERRGHGNPPLLNGGEHVDLIPLGHAVIDSGCTKFMVPTKYMVPNGEFKAPPIVYADICGPMPVPARPACQCSALWCVLLVLFDLLCGLPAKLAVICSALTAVARGSVSAFKLSAKVVIALAFGLLLGLHRFNLSMRLCGLAAASPLCSATTVVPLHVGSDAFVVGTIKGIGAQGASWIIDCGATKHCTNKLSDLFEITEPNPNAQVRVGNGKMLKVTAIGKARLKVSTNLTMKRKGKTKVVPGSELMELSNVLVVPEMHCRLLSSEWAWRHDGIATHLNDSRFLRLPSGARVDFTPNSTDGHYRVETICAATDLTADDCDLMHAALAHFSSGRIDLAKHQGYEGLEGYKHDPLRCPACLANRRKKSIPQKSTSGRVFTYFGECVCSDICGPFVESPQGFTYACNFYDKYSHHAAVYFMKTKEAEEIRRCHDTYLSDHKQWLKDGKITEWVVDDGLNFHSRALDQMCVELATRRSFSVPHVKEKHGAAERLWGILLGPARKVHWHAGNDTGKETLWPFVMTHVCMVHNALPTASLSPPCSPHEMATKQKPNLKIFKGKVPLSDCWVNTNNPKDKPLSKLSSNNVKAVYLCYDARRRADFVYIPELKRITTCYHVTHCPREFTLLGEAVTVRKYTERGDLPTSTGESSSAPRPSFALPPVRDLRGNPAVPAPDGIADVDIMSPTAFVSHADAFTVSWSMNNSWGTNVCVVSPNAVEPVRIPTGYWDAINDPVYGAKWKEACDSEYTGKFVTNQSWVHVHLPGNRTLTKSRWVFKVEYNSDGSVRRFKARIVACGYSQIGGLDYDWDSIYASTLSSDSMRVFLFCANENGDELCEADVVKAFTHAELEESIYMAPPEGYAPKDGKVCLLRKGVEGLKQGANGFMRLNATVMQGLGLKRSMLDPNIYTMTTKDGISLRVGVYVDNLLCAHTKGDKGRAMCAAFLKAYSEKVNLEIRGAPSTFMGVQIEYNISKGTLFLHQKQYIEKAFDKFCDKATKLFTTPVQTSACDAFTKLRAAETDEERMMMSDKPYLSLMGSILWAVVMTRPDCAYYASFLCQFMADPTVECWHAAIALLSYMYNSRNLGLLYKRCGQVCITLYSDSSYGSVPKPAYGYVVFGNGTPLSWASKKEKIVPQSSSEAETYALNAGCKTLMFVKNMLAVLGMTVELPIQTHTDNDATRLTAINPGTTARTKHYHIWMAYVRELYLDLIIAVNWVPTKEQIADLLTKPLDKTTFLSLRTLLMTGSNEVP